MAFSEQLTQDDLHPIDIVETLAENHDWDFERIEDDQIAMAVVGQWRTYSLTLAWSGYDETLRLICSFEIEPSSEKLPAMYELMNLMNDQCWAGAFTFWAEQKLMIYRYGLILSGDQMASPEQIDTMIHNAVASAERYYPAIQLCVWGDQSPSEALQVAMTEAYGRA